MEYIRNKFYRVKSKENLKDICKKLKVSETEIVKLNYITNSSIEEGDLLAVPDSYSFIHIVKPLDNLSTISKKYGVSISHIEEKNNLISKSLFIGQKLII